MNKGKVVSVEKIWLTVAEVSSYLGMTEWFVRDLKKKIPWYKIGNTLFFKKSDIDRLMEKGKNS
jgi:excisionase family DNA binding protein